MPQIHPSLPTGLISMTQWSCLFFVLSLLLALASCSKKPATTAVQFAPGELHLDKAEIESLSAKEIGSKAWTLIIALFDAKKVEDRGVAAKALPKPWRAIYTSWKLESEVENGGFHQYFYNTRCQLLHETLEDLRYLGAKEFTDIFEKAMSGVDVSYYTSGKRNDDDWEKFTTKYADKHWDDLEARFYAEKPKLGEIADKHIKVHPEDYQ